MPRSHLDDRPGEADRVTEAMVDDMVDDMIANMIAAGTPRVGETHSYTTVRAVQGPQVTKEWGDRFDAFARAVDEHSRHADEAMEKKDRIKRRWGYK